MKKRIIIYICYECKNKQVQAWNQLENVKCGDCGTIWETDWEYRENNNDRGYPSYMGKYGRIFPVRK